MEIHYSLLRTLSVDHIQPVYGLLLFAITYGTLSLRSNSLTAMRERMTTAYEEARVALRRAAERNTKYYGVRVRAKEYRKGQLVYYFNPRKFVGRQDKWERKYTGPFLIVGTPSPVTVQLQRRKGAKTMTIHVDKVKPFFGEVPKSRLAGEPSSEVRELPEKAVIRRTYSPRYFGAHTSRLGLSNGQHYRLHSRFSKRSLLLVRAQH